jgi:mRNA interferase MazF
MKDYKSWHILKTELDSLEFDSSDKLSPENPKPMFRERDIWWCSIGENIGYEQDGKHENFERPILILKKFSQDMFLWVPLTSNEKEHSLRYPYTINEKPWCINLTQVRTMSVKRLHRRMGKMSEDHFSEISTLFANIFSLEKAKAPNKSEQSRTPDGEK